MQTRNVYENCNRELQTMVVHSNTSLPNTAPAGDPAKRRQFASIPPSASLIIHDEKIRENSSSVKRPSAERASFVEPNDYSVHQ